MKPHLLAKYMPWAAVFLTVAYFGWCMRPDRDQADDFHFRAFGRLPVIDGGRFKPMDTVARTNLMIITHRQTFYDVDKGVRYPATKWLLDVQTTPPPNHLLTNLLPHGAQESPAWDHKVFRIENDELVRMLGLKMREGWRYSINELRPNIDKLIGEAQRAKGQDVKKLSLFDAKVLELWEHLNLYIRLSGHQFPLVIPDPQGTDEWKPFGTYLEEFAENKGKIGQDEDARAFEAYMKLLAHYDRGERALFNNVLGKHLHDLDSSMPNQMRRIDLEIFFNEFIPFYHCMEVYLLIAVIGALSWLPTSGSPSLRRMAYFSMIIVFLVHTSGLFIRMYLQNRPLVFVTNLYSSAIFIGWGCVLMCLIVDWFFRNGIAIVVGAVTGFCTLFIAHMLSLDGDTMEMMQAVLDTNFWLATHVTCITLGYTTTFVAGFMGITYILLGISTNMLRKEGAANLTRMTYGILCTGMFLSFVGTVLGGIWADQSWGRFWGWDPKENGALLIVLWIAMILHARWGGMIKPRGMAVLSVLGIIITSWSWFGTNFLGVGLHSYGFRQGAMLTLLFVDLVFLGIALLGAFLPLTSWTSFRPLTPEAPSGYLPRKTQTNSV